MKKTIAIAAMAVIFFSSCTKERIEGEGPVITQARTATNFSGISSGFSGKVHFIIDPVYKVEVMAQANIQDAIRTNVVNGILNVDIRNNIKLRSHEPIIVNVSAPSLDFVNVSGSGDIVAQGHNAVSRLDLGISGSGSIKIDEAVVSDKIDARVSGSGNITVNSGSAKNETIEISGSGGMTLTGVTAEKGEIHISGSGNVKVNLSQSLDAHISGSGDIWYLGQPVITTHISGSGKIRPL